MPTSPKIPREVILEHALQMLIRGGYEAVNIKSLAEDIGCSTQPISWHFGSMEGLRGALTEYALNYAESKMRSPSESTAELSCIGAGYISIAFDEPHLFRYLYMSGESAASGIPGLAGFAAESAEAYAVIAEQMGIPPKRVGEFLRSTMIYAHGLACFIVSGDLTASRREISDMVNRAANGFMLLAREEPPKKPPHRTSS